MIVFAIGSFSEINTGKGGHYYSCAHIFEEMDSPKEMLVLGDFLPSALSGRDFCFLECSFGYRNNYKLRGFERKFREAGVKAIHCFDKGSFWHLFPTAKRVGVPIILTKCGGPPANFSYPRAANQVVFHEADFSLFKKIWCKPRTLALIPNRVLRKSPENMLDRPSIFFSKSDIKIIRISRIGAFYAESILQTIELGAWFFQQGYTVEVAVVGHIEDDRIFAKIKDKASHLEFKVYFYTDPHYTSSASDFIPQSNIVVGTGRSFMEGMSYKKVMFFPVKDSLLPCFCSETSYHSAFKDNFSLRVLKSDIVNPDLENIKAERVIFDPQQNKIYRDWLEKTFEKDHSVQGGVGLLYDYYKKVERDSFFRFILNSIIYRLDALKVIGRNRLKNAKSRKI